MFRKAMRTAACVIAVVFLSACGADAPQPVEPTPPALEQKQLKSLQPLCTQLDYEGDPAKPDSVTLTCDDGDKVHIPGPIPVVKANSGGGDAPDTVFIPSESGKHYVWHFFILDTGDMRVWHDDQRVQRTASGEKTTSKFVARNFSESDNHTSYIGW